MINRNWVFGSKAKLDFSTAVPTSPTPSSTMVFNTFEGCASISDAGGNLILYTDGQRVWDGTDTQRFAGLNGNQSATQSAIIVPNPGNVGQYYIFTAGVTGSSQHIDGIRIDTTNWAVTQLSSIMTMPTTLTFSPTEKVTAIQHANCKDFWVVTIIQSGAANLGTFRVFRFNRRGSSGAGILR